MVKDFYIKRKLTRVWTWKYLNRWLKLMEFLPGRFNFMLNTIRCWGAGELKRAGELGTELTMLYLVTGASPRITDAGPHREDSYISDDFIIHSLLIAIL